MESNVHLPKFRIICNRIIDAWSDLVRKSHFTRPITFIIVYLVYGILEAISVSSMQGSIKAHQSINAPLILIDLVAMVLFTVAMSYAMVRVQEQNITSIKHTHFLKFGPYTTDIWLAVGLIIAQIIIKLALDAVSGITISTSSNQSQIDTLMSQKGIPLLWIIIMAMFIAPCMEECLFRFLLIGPDNFKGKRVDQHFRLVMGILSAIFFVYEHMSLQLHTHLTYSSAWSLVVNILLYSLMAVAFTVLYMKTNNIMTSTATHLALDTIITLISVVPLLM